MTEKQSSISLQISRYFFLLLTSIFFAAVSGITTVVLLTLNGLVTVT